MTAIPFIAAAAADGPSMLTVGAGAITALGAAVAAVLRAHQVGRAKGKLEREVTVAGQPVGVRLHDAFLTRTEFMEFKAEIKTDVRSITASVDKMHEVIMLRDETMRRALTETATNLSSKIEAVASGAYESRRKIHEKVNTLEKVTSGLMVKADVSRGLGKLGQALMSRPCVGQTTPPTP